jgi:amino acid transporter
MKDENKVSPKRQYPPLYERLIPIALVIIIVVIVVLLVIIVLVLTGFFP